MTAPIEKRAVDARTPRAAAASATHARLTAGLAAAVTAIPDMTAGELNNLGEELATLAAVIRTEQAEREWVRRNEH